MSKTSIKNVSNVKTCEWAVQNLEKKKKSKKKGKEKGESWAKSLGVEKPARSWADDEDADLAPQSSWADDGEFVSKIIQNQSK